MSDIVKRLRSQPVGTWDVSDLLDEAAAEIERLKAERKNCPPASESEYVQRLEAEIERLKADKEQLGKDFVTLSYTATEKAGEIKRLRGRACRGRAAAGRVPPINDRNL